MYFDYMNSSNNSLSCNPRGLAGNPFSQPRLKDSDGIQQLEGPLYVNSWDSGRNPFGSYILHRGS